MNKKNIIIACVIALVAIVVTGVLILVFSFNKPVYTKESFKELLENNNFEVTDKTSDYNNDNTVDKYIEALNKENDYKIDYYLMASAKQAIDYYDELVNNINKEVKGIKSTIEVDTPKYNKYAIKANGNYSIVIRSSDTIIYINTKESNKDSVNNILKQMSY